jgi:hypothetical protein
VDPDFVSLAASEIRHFGAGSLQVARRLRAMLEHPSTRFAGSSLTPL